MADLPEHLAQVAIWKRFADACHDFASLYELHYATPYLLGYALIRLLATVCTVTTAATLVVWMAILALPLSVRVLLLRAGADPWLSLLAFPLAYGYAFYWGFLNFLIAIPIAVIHVALLFDRRPWAQTILGVLLMASHGLLFAFAAAVTLGFAIVKRSWRTAATILPGALLMAAFLLSRTTTERTVTWKPGPSRLTDFSSVLFANAWEPAGLALLGAMIVAIAVAGPRLSRDPTRWIPGVVAVLSYLALPFGMSGTAYVYPRFAIFVAIGALLFVDVRTRAISRVLIVVIAIVWCSVTAARFHRFDAEARELDPLIERIPPARRVAQMNVHAFSDHVPGPVYWHAGAYYQVRRGGIVAWSFASLESWYPSIVRFRSGAEPVIASRTTPVDGMDWPGLLAYDYVLVRGSDPRRGAFRDAPQPLKLVGRSGSWWLFETPHAGGPQRSCAALGE